jgi:hypothetical protein
VTKPRKLPPDPDGKNDERAGWARGALRNFQGRTGVDDEDAICDLLANLMHLCDRQPEFGKFKTQLARARQHYEWETTEEDEEA